MHPNYNQRGNQYTGNYQQRPGFRRAYHDHHGGRNGGMMSSFNHQNGMDGAYQRPSSDYRDVIRIHSTSGPREDTIKVPRIETAIRTSTRLTIIPMVVITEIKDIAIKIFLIAKINSNIKMDTKLKDAKKIHSAVSNLLKAHRSPRRSKKYLKILGRADQKIELHTSLVLHQDLIQLKSDADLVEIRPHREPCQPVAKVQPDQGTIEDLTRSQIGALRDVPGPSTPSQHPSNVQRDNAPNATQEQKDTLTTLGKSTIMVGIVRIMPHQKVDNQAKKEEYEKIDEEIRRISKETDAMKNRINYFMLPFI
ncbi:hypothetical protein GCK72_022428 [Caenorhabditis remanei]|uniref:Uncharacterized protein n=1 Tax=Caenorhabditis remanei TaxID=31234 RepID=A0A6A5FTQ3_CAERE|nr:hypothetical protein GCK72_022428 [Caenorhabditis remanei]KAF1745978.1 hypothetical protein GCK72_022428 [Caenorhabditis remanei]